MRELRLIERIQAWEKEPHRRTTEDPKRIFDSVLNHLKRILNTRRGSVQIADDYGIPDFTDFLYTYPDSLRDMERSLKKTIMKFEPRLQAVRIRFIPREEDTLSMSFQVFAKLATQKGKVPVRFDSTFDPDGKVSIKG